MPAGNFGGLICELLVVRASTRQIAEVVSGIVIAGGFKGLAHVNSYQGSRSLLCANSSESRLARQALEVDAVREYLQFHGLQAGNVCHGEKHVGCRCVSEPLCCRVTIWCLSSASGSRLFRSGLLRNPRPTTNLSGTSRPATSPPTPQVRSPKWYCR